MTDNLIHETVDTDLVRGRWEPCAVFAPEVTDSQVCGDCGWLHDDHLGDAVIRHFRRGRRGRGPPCPVAWPRSDQASS
jgi:hypothetical protein